MHVDTDVPQQFSASPCGESRRSGVGFRWRARGASKAMAVRRRFARCLWALERVVCNRRRSARRVKWAHPQKIALFRPPSQPSNTRPNRFEARSRVGAYRPLDRFAVSAVTSSPHVVTPRDVAGPGFV